MIIIAGITNTAAGQHTTGHRVFPACSRPHAAPGRKREAPARLGALSKAAGTAVRGLLAGTLEAATQQQATALGPTAPCPDCGQPCPLTTEEREVTVRQGAFVQGQPKAHCPACRVAAQPSVLTVCGA